MLQLSIGPRSGACKCGATSGWDVFWQQEDRSITGHGPTGCMQARQVPLYADLRFWAMGSYTFGRENTPGLPWHAHRCSAEPWTSRRGRLVHFRRQLFIKYNHENDYY